MRLLRPFSIACFCGGVLAASAQRTNTDSLLLVVGVWQQDHAAGDTTGLVQMNRLAVIFSMRLEIERQVDVLRRAVAVAEADRAKLSPGKARDRVGKHLIDSYGLLGDALTYQGDLEAAMYNSERMYSTALETGDSVQAAGACQHLSLQCAMIEDNQRALAWARRCLALTPKDGTVPLAQAYSELAQQLYRADAPDSALLLWRKAIALQVEDRAPITAFDAHDGCFRIHLEAGDMDSAAFHLLRARDAFGGEPSGINTSRMQLMEARYLMALDRPEDALRYLQRADSFAVAHGLHAGRYAIAQLLSTVYHRLGDLRASRMAADTALAEVKLHLGIDEARRTAAFQERITMMAEQEAAAAALTAQRRVLIIASIACVVLLIAGVLLFLAVRRGKRYAAELARTNRQLVGTQEQLVRTEREREAEAVRTRIARDIHDELGGNLTKLALMGDMLRTAQEGTLPEEVSLELMSAEARSLKEGLNDVVWAVDPGADTVGGLLDQIRDRITRMFAGAPAQLHLDLNAARLDRPLRPDVRRAVYLVVREAAHNALKHSSATRISVLVSITEGAYRIQVTDNGVGFSLSPAQGHGLRNMQERISALGGTFSIESAQGATSVLARGAL
ncbi:MAG TPA: histidine kinase [Flavobacteriales bacterium]|nr:histidine kinase [Flavobacteriales bacterium]HMR26133.1 histidine kinase [Flavobacteriales bacterium]